MSAMLPDDGTEARLHRLGTFLKSGQSNSSRIGVSRLRRHMRTDEREPVAPRGQLREEFTVIDARLLSRDRRERAAILGRCMRLRIERVDVTRRPPQPNEDN